jgi:hypothetical protein
VKPFSSPEQEGCSVLVALLALALVLLAVLAVFVVALLRSHAETIRRLVALERAAPGEAEWQHSADSAAAVAPVSAKAPAGSSRPRALPVPPIVGRTLAGDAVQLDAAGHDGPTLLAFLSSGCAACEPLWEGLRSGAAVPAGARLLVIVKDASEESPGRIQELAPPGWEVLMSTQAWRDYAVPSSPHFVLVDGRPGAIAGRGAARSWSQISAIVAQALADAAYAREPSAVSGDAQPARSTSERAVRAELALAAAGIGPGHPSLYPDASPSPVRPQP